jgi:ParB/RepB/Spo0J family partition protein
MTKLKQSAAAHLSKMVSGAAGQVAPKTVAVPPDPTKLEAEAAMKLLEQIGKKGKTVQTIPLSLISLDENIRRQYDEEALRVLASSLEKDGLIQFPTLCLKKKGKEYELICRNGHRRILAAKSLGWTRIDCIVMAIESEINELYHTINANLREDVFYLDLALAYQEAANLGESDDKIAARVGVNPRTVGWYRRWASIDVETAKLIRDHADLFNATWAVNLARRGPLPKAELLLTQMRSMIAAGKTWLEFSEQVPKTPIRQGASGEDRSSSTASSKLKAYFGGKNGEEHVRVTRDVLGLLVQAGYLSEKLLNKIQKEFLGSANKSGPGVLQGRGKEALLS